MGSAKAYVSVCGVMGTRYTDMMRTYFEGKEEALDGFELLSMADAGELTIYLAGCARVKRAAPASGLALRREAADDADAVRRMRA